METRKYKIIMQTPIGSKDGFMTAEVNETYISGYLEILGNKNVFQGTVDRNKNCRITGQLVTLMRTIDYVAYGQMNHESVYLSLHDGKNILYINGYLCKTEEDIKK